MNKKPCKLGAHVRVYMEGKRKKTTDDDKNGGSKQKSGFQSLMKIVLGRAGVFSL